MRSPKTEHHAGHAVRVVPITAELMPLLQDQFDACEPGREHLVALRMTGAARRKVKRYIKAAKVQPWDRLWQTLRSSCEKQWAMTFPQYAVSQWIGHSITVSGRHYTNGVPDELFDRAANLDGEPGEGASGALQKAVQQPAADDGNDP